MDNFQPNSGLNSTQKTGFVLLLVFGILAVGLGFLQMRNNIYGPFVVRLADSENDTEIFVDEQTRLQTIDTDHDGINDWEELNFYETSPYLPDTDSDGIDDDVEIKDGTDPLCPKGQECGEIDYTGLATTSIGIFDEADLITADEVFGDSALAEDQANLDLASALGDPTKLRELLLSAGGITKEQLDAIDDDMLLQIVGELMGSPDLLGDISQATTSFESI